MLQQSKKPGTTYMNFQPLKVMQGIPVSTDVLVPLPILYKMKGTAPEIPSWYRSPNKQSHLSNSYITSEHFGHHQAPPSTTSQHAPGVLAGLYVEETGMPSALMPGTSGKPLCYSTHTLLLLPQKYDMLSLLLK
jgi:hypothetical protein